MLRDKQDAAVAMGKSPEDDWTWALYWYSGKGESYAREVITRSVEYKKRLEAPLEKKWNDSRKARRMTMNRAFFPLSLFALTACGGGGSRPGAWCKSA